MCLDQARQNRKIAEHCIRTRLASRNLIGPRSLAICTDESNLLLIEDQISIDDCLIGNTVDQLTDGAAKSAALSTTVPTAGSTRNHYRWTIWPMISSFRAMLSRD